MGRRRSEIAIQPLSQTSFVFLENEVDFLNRL